ncbi:phosphoribosylaminoimidazolesuccinocarboxamide synthase [Paenibacillus sp. FSL R7-0048]|jgi:phosphoribosylaminoimidazole-succinocarboxamide synthase|uniref:phosphoribosylaminoimidazolesuccinocarboxamide synthase n=1 Tax=Paenibacillus TaxID=44249 RepID=UPI00096BF1F7|nr:MULTISPECIES: phosphoribosylaminoimidazolesuccinocarboxamide synthase [Paenibacillus]MDH6430659.1 phosphoribosylaminoimidazole-succinocarboxamide synthase [Paenibacillus sp. PastH-4]MDH6446646.1 phosphoribosylaminoimidazole-succinocarboxamide synthase [Paenibacillus sp. PastF-4]MDH6530896.1 phosphoribosylaminoimidazole-succinocarboxamide synthase [Paenibacillus sp. PastH-3]OMC62629.1 phosphoribosylaminoimidazolesuccinocarboxamide synthase [Paenibacillus odorifer]OMC64489.1 phosphoribosylami
MTSSAVSTAVELINAPLLYKGKVRELYDLGENVLIVVTDRISAFDYVLDPAVPEKGNVLNRLSAFWFGQTKELMENHVVHIDVDLLGDVVKDKEALRNRVMVVRKAERIDIECVVRGCITGGGWRQYQETGKVNGIELPANLRKNALLAEPIFTPAAKNDVGHDEDIPFEKMQELIGADLALELQEKSLKLFAFAREYCAERGIILADCKFEFGLLDGKVILIDEIFTPDASRFWAKDKYALDIEIDSMDKEPVRTYLSASSWDKNSKPDPLPLEVVEETTRRYLDIYHRLTGKSL